MSKSSEVIRGLILEGFTQQEVQRGLRRLDHLDQEQREVVGLLGTELCDIVNERRLGISGGDVYVSARAAAELVRLTAIATEIEIKLKLEQGEINE